MSRVLVVGGGLAGCEAAIQLARRGVSVELHEMRPHRRSPVHASDRLGELVCSNSLRAMALGNAVGLLKEELRRAGSAIMSCADSTRVPSGGALGVDRERFSTMLTEAVCAEPGITLVRHELTDIPDERPVVLATGPLTSDALASRLEAVVGRAHLAYYDAIAPIVSADSINWDRVFKQSRYDKGEPAYVNCPMNELEYGSFVDALMLADKVPAREFELELERGQLEQVRYFEGCLPIEVMAGRGRATLAFGPLKPVGLTDPRTGRRPFAVVQLRPENAAETAYNLVGLQTRLKHFEQLCTFRMIPGLEQAEFLRLGSMHRNTFVDAPHVLDPTMQLRAAPGVYVAGQLSGVEGYVESAAGGLLCGLMLAERLGGREPLLPPPTSALGGLCTHLGRETEDYQPSNVTWALVPPLEGRFSRYKKRERYELMAERALADLAGWLTHMHIGSTPE
jgi:methylenetetrahydrofolate--tRNA-(uracil-5-)-methyltransferase